MKSTEKKPLLTVETDYLLPPRPKVGIGRREGGGTSPVQHDPLQEDNPKERPAKAETVTNVIIFFIANS